MSKLAGFMYDLAGVAPNTKVSSTKLIAALKSLHTDGQIVNVTKQSDSAFFDRCDVTIRIMFGMYREVKNDEAAKGRVMKTPSPTDQKKIILVLEKLQLPKEFLEDVMEKSPVPISCVSPCSTPRSVNHTPKTPKSWGNWGESQSSKEDVLAIEDKCILDVIRGLEK